MMRNYTLGQLVSTKLRNVSLPHTLVIPRCTALLARARTHAHKQLGAQIRGQADATKGLQTFSELHLV